MYFHRLLFFLITVNLSFSTDWYQCLRPLSEKLLPFISNQSFETSFFKEFNGFKEKTMTPAKDELESIRNRVYILCQRPGFIDRVNQRIKKDRPFFLSDLILEVVPTYIENFSTDKFLSDSDDTIYLVNLANDLLDYPNVVVSLIEDQLLSQNRQIKKTFSEYTSNTYLDFPSSNQSIFFKQYENWLRKSFKRIIENQKLDEELFEGLFFHLVFRDIFFNLRIYFDEIVEKVVQSSDFSFETFQKTFDFEIRLIIKNMLRSKLEESKYHSLYTAGFYQYMLTKFDSSVIERGIYSHTLILASYRLEKKEARLVSGISTTYDQTLFKPSKNNRLFNKNKPHSHFEFIDLLPSSELESNFTFLARRFERLDSIVSKLSSVSYRAMQLFKLSFAIGSSASTAYFISIVDQGAVTPVFISMLSSLSWSLTREVSLKSKSGFFLDRIKWYLMKKLKLGSNIIITNRAYEKLNKDEQKILYLLSHDYSVGIYKIKNPLNLNSMTTYELEKHRLMPEIIKKLK